MKKINSNNRKSISIATFIVGIAIASLCTATTNAQVYPKNLNSRLTISRKADRASDRFMQEARKRLENAERQMNTALPIYEGHRDNAIDLTRIAMGEIKIGLLYDELHDRNKASAMDVGRRKRQPEGRRDKRHSNEQVRRSNTHLMEARKLIEDAIVLMRRAEPDYGGHRQNAIESSLKSLDQLKTAINLVHYK